MRDGKQYIGMPRYPSDQQQYDYRCEDCGTVVPSFQGLYWFSERQEKNGSEVDIPYCPKCHSTNLNVNRS